MAEAKCICEDGEPKRSMDMMGSYLTVHKPLGTWTMTLEDGWGESCLSFHPIRFCPICGKELS